MFKVNFMGLIFYVLGMQKGIEDEFLLCFGAVKAKFFLP